MPVTHKDIAEKLGVSKQLVGLALSGQGRVAPATRLRIERAAMELGYDKFGNANARALIAKRYGNRVETGVIAVTLPYGERSWDISGPFFSELLIGIEEEASERCGDVYLCGYREGRRVPRLISDGAVDGIICLGHPCDWLNKIRSLEIPVVALFRSDEELHAVESGLLVDDRCGIFQAVQHLVELGHRKIAYLGQPPSFHIAASRLAAYRDALRCAGIDIDESRIHASIDMISVARPAIESFLNRSMDWTAMVCYNDSIAMDAILLLSQRGIRVPQDVSVVGFDDTASQQGFKPGLTSAAFDRAVMGRIAVQVLYEMYNSRKHSVLARIESQPVPVHLVVRDSTAPADR